MTSSQLSLEFDDVTESYQSPAITQAVDDLSSMSDPNSRGAIFTRSEVVGFILDLVGYTSDCALFEKRVLEPSFGGGDFLLPIVQRLLESWENAGSPNTALASPQNFAKTIKGTLLGQVSECKVRAQQ